MEIAAVGEAWGEKEEEEGLPFIGSAGQELSRLFRDAGIARSDVHLTNVFNERPPANKVYAFCSKKKDFEKGSPSLTYSSLGEGFYVREEYLHHITRLREELSSLRPNLVIALGNTALWALCGTTGITKYRGTVCSAISAFGDPPLKVLPTFHPAYILRKYDDRVISVMDMLKAKREMEFPEIRRPSRTIWIQPTFDDLLEFEQKYISQASIIDVDIETGNKYEQIRCVSIAVSPHLAIVIPFVSQAAENFSYWGKDEHLVWEWLRIILEDPALEKRFQNGAFDVMWFWKYGIRVRAWTQDTMIKHHAIYPELQKSLAMMGSIYTNEVAWKTMRPRGQASSKREE